MRFVCAFGVLASMLSALLSKASTLACVARDETVASNRASNLASMLSALPSKASTLACVARDETATSNKDPKTRKPGRDLVPFCAGFAPDYQR